MDELLKLRLELIKLHLELIKHEVASGKWYLTSSWDRECLIKYTFSLAKEIQTFHLNMEEPFEEE